MDATTLGDYFFLHYFRSSSFFFILFSFFPKCLSIHQVLIFCSFINKRAIVFLNKKGEHNLYFLMEVDNLLDDI